MIYLEFILLSETHRCTCMSFDNNNVDFSTIGTRTEPKSNYKAWHVASSFRSYVHQTSYFTKNNFGANFVDICFSNQKCHYIKKQKHLNFENISSVCTCLSLQKFRLIS